MRREGEGWGWREWDGLAGGGTKMEVKERYPNYVPMRQSVKCTFTTQDSEI